MGYARSFWLLTADKRRLTQIEKIRHLFSHTYLRSSAFICGSK